VVDALSALRRRRPGAPAILLLAVAGSLAAAPSLTAQTAPGPRGRPFEISFYGRQGVSRLSPAERSVFEKLDAGPPWGHETELRIMADVRVTERITFQLHNEIFYQGGPARRRLFDLASGADAATILDTDRLMDDRRRLFDLTWTLDRTAERLVVNRFDRFSASARLGATSVKVGRQVVTWGNGMLFNPFDLFSPFSPVEIEREYKRGEDGASWKIDAGERLGTVDVVSMFRRDEATGEADMRHASIGVKHHRLMNGGQWEITSLALEHWGDLVLGGGGVARLGDVVGRSEWTYTSLADGGSAWAGVANLDFAWIWGGLNSYAGIEYHYSGFGESGKADADPAIARALRERFARGELFVRGRHYLDGRFDIEVHPLVRVAVTAVTNAADGSGTLQPAIVWDATSRMQFRIVRTWMWGSRDTEFGGARDEATGLTDRMPNRIDARLTMSF
jgi:hypothetical protein